MITKEQDIKSTAKRLTKKQKAIVAQLGEQNKLYQLDEALTLLKNLPAAKFKKTVESVDVSIHLGIDPKKSDQAVRGATVLPHGTGKTVKVAVFAQGQKAEDALAAGADVVGMDDLAESIKSGNFDFNVIIASPDAMRVVGALGPILGPRGLMPNPKVGTVTMDVAKAVTNAKSGQLMFRNDKAGIVHGCVGKVNFEVAALRGNIEALLQDLRKHKPASAKGLYIKKLTVSSTMGPGLPVDLSSVG